jgi:small ligand-binding sensory domain FIST
MSVKIAVGVSESFDPVEAFSEAADEAARRLDARCDLCVLFAGAPHLPLSKWILSAVHERLDPVHLIGCGAGGVVGAGREIGEGPGAVV